jgi:hypothetical protein
MLFLGKDSNRMVALGWKCHFLKAHSSNEAVGGDPWEFNGFDQVWMNICHSVYPHERGKVAYNLGADPVTSLESAKEHGWVLGDARDNDVFAGLVDNVGVHPEC